jgi:hypothetical protein
MVQNPEESLWIHGMTSSEPFYIIGALAAKLHPGLYRNNNPHKL